MTELGDWFEERLGAIVITIGFVATLLLIEAKVGNGAIGGMEGLGGGGIFGGSGGEICWGGFTD